MIYAFVYLSLHIHCQDLIIGVALIDLDVYYVVHMTFGKYIRKSRESLRERDAGFSVRQVAQRVGIEPAYLSKIERDQVAPPSESTIRKLAVELNEDSDILLAMAGKISCDLKEIILNRPELFLSLIHI